MMRAVSGWKRCYPMGAELQRRRSSSVALPPWRRILEGLPSPPARQKPSSTLSEPPVSMGFRMVSGCAETRTEEEAPMLNSSTSSSSMSPSVPTFSGDKNLKRKIRDEINIPLEKQFLYSADGKPMENDEKLLIDYGILNQQTYPYGAIRIFLCLDQRGMIACGTFSMAFACEAGVFLCCDSQSSYLVKRENDKKITYMQVKDNIEKMTLVDENIAFVMAGDIRKFPLLRAVVAKVHHCLQHSHKEFTLEDITSAMHAEISPNPDVFVGVTAIFADRRMSAYNIVKWKAKTAVSVPENHFRSAAIGSGAFHAKFTLSTGSVKLSYAKGEKLCCCAGRRALDMDKACGGRFRVFFANKNQPWSAQPNAEFPVATLMEMIRLPWGFSDRPSIGNFFDDGRNENINDEV